VCKRQGLLSGATPWWGGGTFSEESVICLQEACSLLFRGVAAIGTRRGLPYLALCCFSVIGKRVLLHAKSGFPSKE